MTVPAAYPPADQKLDGTAPGAWSGVGEWKLCLHTTETTGVPGYSDGDLAPHLTYVPATRKWVQHYPLTRPSESLRTFDNDQIFQVEIVCYSAKHIADGRSSRLWVGELENHHLHDLADFTTWLMGHVPIDPVWPGKQALSWSQANSPGFRYTADELHAFGGILGHQHVTANTHWDPGAFPWTDYINLLEDTMPLTPDDLEAIRGIVRDELGGGRIEMPDVGGMTRFGNQGVVNSVWHATSAGKKLFDVLTDIPDDTADELADRLAE